MTRRLILPSALAALLALFFVALSVRPAMSHHSFAMYDQTKTVAMTGVMTRFVAQANHAEIHFVPLGPDSKPVRGTDGKPTTWGVEMAGAAAVARQGITIKSFPVGTIFSVKLHPLRDGSSFGARIGAIARCPTGKATAAGKHCDSVEGSELLGGTEF
jgi:hypothetical protein